MLLAVAQSSSQHLCMWMRHMQVTAHQETVPTGRWRWRKTSIPKEPLLALNRQDDCQYLHDEVLYVSSRLHQLSRAVMHGWTNGSFLGWHVVLSSSHTSILLSLALWSVDSEAVLRIVLVCIQLGVLLDMWPAHSRCIHSYCHIVSVIIYGPY